MAGDWCYPKDGPELEDAIANSTCVYFNLQQTFNTPENPYRLDREIIIDRHVVIQGNSLELPFIDCFDTVRCFRVVPGGYFEMRYVNINQGRCCVCVYV